MDDAGGCFGRAIRGGMMALLIAISGCQLIAEPQEGLACQQPPDPDEVLGDRDVPDVMELTPAAAAERLDQADIPVSWRYYYTTNPPSRVEGYSECWCVPPPDGQVMNVAAEADEQLIVTIQREAPMPGGRPQPRQGWGCDEA